MLQTLLTPAGERLSGTPWPDYPRPQFRRAGWMNLNGLWEFAVTDGGNPPSEFPREILVPFCPECTLSGIGAHYGEGQTLWYRRRFTLPEGFAKDRVVLHIGAADQLLGAWCSGTPVGRHLGGYESMTFDLTDALRPGENELVLRVRDDLRSTVLPYGKQVLQRGGMWYTPVSGIWQTVWLESLPAHAIPGLTIRADDRVALLDTGDSTQEGTVTVQTPQGPLTVPLRTGRAAIRPEAPRLWSPADPYLYEFAIDTPTDHVESYFALRKLTIGQAGGHPRLCLNGQPVFFHGVLDQGYYSDGLFTPADPACYEQDIRTMQNLGFNTLRKHIKVEPEIFYWLCDKLGMFVFQDMVNNGDYAYWRDTVWPTLGCSAAAATPGCTPTRRPARPSTTAWRPRWPSWGITPASSTGPSSTRVGGSLPPRQPTPGCGSWTIPASSTPPRAGSGAATPTWTAAISTMAPGGCGQRTNPWCSPSSAAAASRWRATASTPTKATATAPATARRSCSRPSTGSTQKRCCPRWRKVSAGPSTPSYPTWRTRSTAW